MSWFNISSVTSIHPSIHSNCPPCLYFVVLFFYVLHVVANNEALWAGSMSFCVLCVCATFVLALHVSHVCLFVCLRVLRLVTTCVLSVTKRHKAHLKRLDRRWTLGGVISRQQSRGELRQTLHRLPLLPLLPFVIVLLTPSHLLSLITWLNSSLLTCTYLLGLSSCVIFQQMHLS